jgi:hypothetical protein
MRWLGWWGSKLIGCSLWPACVGCCSAGWFVLWSCWVCVLFFILRRGKKEVICRGGMVNSTIAQPGKLGAPLALRTPSSSFIHHSYKYIHHLPHTTSLSHDSTSLISFDHSEGDPINRDRRGDPRNLKGTCSDLSSCLIKFYFLKCWKLVL